MGTSIFRLRGVHAPFFRAVGAVSTLRIAGSGLMLLAQMLLAGWMGVEAFGVYSYAWAWVAILGTLAGVGFGPASVRFIAKYRAESSTPRIHGVLRFGRILTLVSGTIISLVAILIASIWASDSPYFDALRVALLAVPVLAVLNLEAAQARGFEWMALATCAEQVARPLLLIILALWLAEVAGRSSAIWFVAACTVAYLLATVGQHAVLRWRVRNTIHQCRAAFDVGIWLRVAIPLLLQSGAYIILINTDLVMLGFLLEPAQVGLYTAAMRVATLVLFVQVVSSLVAQPTIVALHTRDQRDDLQRFVTMATRWIFLASAMIGIAMMFLGGPILGLFGPDFVAGLPALWILVGAYVVVAGTGPVNTLLVMTGHQDWAALVFGVSVLTNVGLNLALVPSFGIVGAAMAVGGNLILTNIALLVLVRRRLGVWSGVIGWTGAT